MEIMKKFNNAIENVTIFYEAAKDNPKKSIAIIIAALMMLYCTIIAISRVPNALGCYWKAEIEQSVPDELYRYNWISDSCQYYNGSRFIPLDKVIDVGAGEDLENVN